MRRRSVRDAHGPTHGIRDTAGRFNDPSMLARTMRAMIRMDTASRWLVAHGEHLRLAWLLMLVLLAACNNNGDGGANGYDRRTGLQVRPRRTPRRGSGHR